MSDEIVTTATTAENTPKKRIFSVSASSLTTMQACAYKYLHGHIKRLVPITTEPALDYGSLIHFMLHPYYFSMIRNPKDYHLKHPFAPLIGKPLKDAVDAAVAMGSMRALLTDLSPNDRIAAIDRFVQYTDVARNDGWEILEVEQPFSIVLYEDADLIILYEGIVDLKAIIPNKGDTLVDHKTGGRDSHIPETNNQIVGSCLAFDVKTFYINKILETKDNPFRRYPYSVISEQKREWLRDSIHWVKQTIHYIDSDYYPLNRSSCSSFGKCRFLPLCSCPISARQIKLEALYKPSGHQGIYNKSKELAAIAEKVLGKYATP